MQFAVTFRHMEPTDALKSYAKERMERVRKYLPDPIACHVVLIDRAPQPPHRRQLPAPQRALDRRSRDDREHVQLDRPVHREDRAPGPQVQGQARGHARAPARRDAAAVVALDHRRGVPRDGRRTATAVPSEPPSTQHRGTPSSRSCKTEKFHAQPMSVADAIVQLNLLHEPFLVFRARYRRSRRGRLQA